MRTVSIFVLAFAAAAFGLAVHAAAEGTVTGNVEFDGFTVNFKHVYLLTAPDVFDPKAVVRTLIFTDADISNRIKLCDSVFCATELVLNGMTVEFSSNPRLTYWVGVKNQIKQISGSAIPAEVFRAKVNTPNHLAGVLMIDDYGIKGPKATAEFNVTLTKAFKTHG
jgi:hypothetical protein